MTYKDKIDKLKKIIENNNGLIDILKYSMNEDNEDILTSEQNDLIFQNVKLEMQIECLENIILNLNKLKELENENI
jgi:ABC-type polar amino acid transport system ATPase subunit